MKLYLKPAIAKYIKFPTKILFPEDRFEPYQDKTVRTMMKFVSGLNKAAGVPTTTIDIPALWNEKAPPGTSSVEEYLATVSPRMVLQMVLQTPVLFS